MTGANANLPLSCRRFLKTISEIEQRLAVDVYLVGGFVRDIFLKRIESVPDIDFVLEEKAEQFAVEAAKISGGELRKFPAFCTFKIERPSVFPFLPEFDVASARTEIYQCPGALPKVKAATISEDLSRRDFSINALAVRLVHLVNAASSDHEITEELRPRVIDMNRGLDDLEERKIRVLHERSFFDDPTRLFRACRYAARINGEFDGRTNELALEAVEKRALSTISWFRILTELRKVLQEESRKIALERLHRYNILENIPCVPEANSKEFAESVTMIGNLPSEYGGSLLYEVLLRLIAFFSDPEGLFRAANLSKEERESIVHDLRNLNMGQDSGPLSAAGRIMREHLGYLRRSS